MNNKTENLAEKKNEEKKAEKETYISCSNLALGYNGIAVTEGLSFEVNAGDYLCIVGENGAGKSTLMKTLLGLQAPVSGQITRSDSIKKGGIGFLPQQSAVQKDFPASVYEVVLSGNLPRIGHFPFYRAQDHERTRKNMERLSITQLKDSCYRDLSGGQQQRVMLARALCATTSLLLLDEPVNGLDPKVTADMYELIKSLNDSGVTIMMISHDIRSAVRYGSHILHIGKKQLFYGKTEDYINSKAFKVFGGAFSDEEDEENE